jgi:hypothetical protein
MAMTKSTVKSPPEGKTPLGRHHPLRWVMLLTLAFTVVLVAGRMLWTYVQPQIAADPQYRLTVDSVFVTPPPPWIKVDVRGEVLRSATVGGPMSVLDEDLLPRLSQAFQLHPWVTRVTRISKRVPARVDVELEYRRPVCMVEVPGGLYPVDREAVLLPSADFSPSEALNYPRLARVEKVTEGPVGTRWHDPQVEGAALLGEVLLPVWSEARLKRIVPSREAAVDRGRLGFELLGSDGVRFLWGSAPGNEAPGELTAADKLQRLRQLATRGDSSSTGLVYDLRFGTAVVHRSGESPAR